MTGRRVEKSGTQCGQGRKVRISRKKRPCKWTLVAEIFLRDETFAQKQGCQLSDEENWPRERASEENTACVHTAAGKSSGDEEKAPRNRRSCKYKNQDSYAVKIALFSTYEKVMTLASHVYEPIRRY